MPTLHHAPHLIWTVAALSTAGVLARPFRLPEAVWAVLGAAALYLTGQLTMTDTARAVGKGLDVYLFLTGMMLIAELARTTGLFDHVAAHAVRMARGSSTRLFCLVYLIGIVVTVFMSNDATAVVLTPAVLAAARAAKLEKPLPHLLACALIANAASFVLPISNPANLVVFASRMPSLADWLHWFLLPSAASIAATFAALYWLQRRALAAPLREPPTNTVPPLTAEAKLTAAGIAGMAAALMLASTLGADLGWPSCLAGAATLALAAWRRPKVARDAFSGVSWSVLPLVAGLFVLVEAVSRTGLLQMLVGMIEQLHAQAPTAAAWIISVLTALLTNVANNLPAGLFAGVIMTTGHAPAPELAGTLIGIDLGPNLSVTGSLATLLWLNALRREGIEVSALAFLRIGAVVMPAALVSALLLLGLA